jgi:CRP/FNR family transcriptional regulator, cyclic AMP receptor protein
MSRREQKLPKPTKTKNGWQARRPEGLKDDIRDAHPFLTTNGNGKSMQTYQCGQALFMQGERAAQVFYIQRGRVKVSAASEHGKDAVVGILEQGQFVGEACLTGQQVRLTTAVAIDVSRLTVITESAMREALQHEHGFAQSFVAYLLARKNRVEDDLIDQLLNSSEKRLARLLLILANYGRDDAQPITDVTLDQGTLAEIVGTTRSRVSLFMNRFRSAGHINYNGPYKSVEVRRSLLDLVVRDTAMIREKQRR